jgi:hypothetical protein
MALTIGSEAEFIREARLKAGLGADGSKPVARLGLVMLTRDAARRLVAFAFEGGSTGWSALSGGPPETPRLSPVATQDILAMIGAALGLDEELPAAELRYRGAAAGLWALAGLVDAHRQQGLEALLARRAPPPFAVSADVVELRLIDAATMADPRWFASMLDMLAGPAPAGEKEVAQGLSALRAAGLIDEDPIGLWHPSEAAMAAFAELEAPLAGVALSLATRQTEISASDGDGDLPQLLVLVRTLTGLVLVQPAADDGMELRFVRGSDMITLLGSELARATSQAEGRMPPPRFCTICGVKAAPGDRFCASCGAPLVR